jgi:hypothetical protein
MKKKTKTKKIKLKTPQKVKIRTSQLYKQCLQLCIKIAEDVVDFGDFHDNTVDALAVMRKSLNKREQDIIGALAMAAAGPKTIEIDESTPGSELQFKV